MNIIMTSIPDVSQYLDSAKTDLGNLIVKGISPVLDEVYISKISETKNVKIKYKKLRSQVNEMKHKMKSQLQELENKKKVKKILDKVSRLISAGLGYDSKFRNEIIVLLKVIDNLSDEKLDFHLNDISTLINKRFSQ